MGILRVEISTVLKVKESLGILPSVEDNNKLIAVFMGYPHY
jgi:hypothetical protein